MKISYWVPTIVGEAISTRVNDLHQLLPTLCDESYHYELKHMHWLKVFKKLKIKNQNWICKIIINST